jgi:hypothetical protein
VIRDYSVGFVPHALVDYRLHGTNMHSSVARQERDMLIAYDKVFARPDPQVLSLKREAYARLHMTLAGSYFIAKRPIEFARHAMRSVWLDPGMATSLLGYPARLARRAFARRALARST